MADSAVEEQVGIKDATKKAFTDKVPAEPKKQPADSAPTPAQPAAKPAEAAAQPQANSEPAPTPAAEPQESVAVTPNYDDISDEEFEKILAKRTKGAVKSLNDLVKPVPKTKEEIEAEEAKDASDSLEWAIGSGKVKREDYDAGVILKSKTNREIALELFAQEIKQEDPKATPEEIDILFKTCYQEDADENDPQRKLRLKEMNRLADGYRKEKAGVLDTIGPEYKAYRQTEQRKTAFFKQVDNVFESMPKERILTFKYPHADGSEQEISIPYTIDDADIKALKKIVKQDATFNMAGADKGEVKDSDLQGGIDYHLKTMVFDKIMPIIALEAAKKARMDTEAFLKNIPVRDRHMPQGDNLLGGEQGRNAVNDAENARARKAGVSSRYQR